jgi:hypothetical protein
MTDAGLARAARRRRLVGAALVVAFAAVLIAIVVVRSAGEKVLNENGDTLVLVGKDDDVSGMTLRGTLADVGGCLGIVDEADGAGLVVIWPHGTTVATPEPLRLRLGGRTHEIGDRLDVAGAITGPLEPSDATYDFYDKVPEGCREARVYVAGVA